MNDEILKLAKECGIDSFFAQLYVQQVKAFYHAAFNAGLKAQRKISIPTNTMEQEFLTHYRRGFNAGLEAAAKECKLRLYFDAERAIRELEQ